MRRNRHRPSLVLTAVMALWVTLLVASSVASATVTTITRRGYFRVSVSGVQKTVWSANHQAATSCNDSSYKGHGSEQVRFASTHTVRVLAFQFGSYVQFVANKRPASLPTRGWVRRTGTLTTGSNPLCPPVGDGGGGGSKPQPPDCGRKTISSLPMTISYEWRPSDWITVHPREVPQRPRFKNCPTMATVSWPTLLTRDDRNRPIGQDLSPRLLFEGGWGKMLVLGEGKVSYNHGGISSTTTINWTLTLVRLKR